MKENHGIRHIEWNISLQWMKRQKKYCLMVVWVAILACMLMQTGFLITDGISSAVMNQRKNIYGEWEYGLVNMDADSQTLIEDHPFIESKGKIQIYGVLAGSYMDNKQANIGTMDQTAWNIGHLQMLKGHLPENEQEIAMESGMLTVLGYQGEPGEKITLNIVTTTAYKNDMVGKAYTYTLCGVIKDYQVNWDICNRNRFPTGIVTKAGAERIGSPLESHMLIRADKGDSVYEDLKKSVDIQYTTPDPFERLVHLTDPQFQTSARYLISIKTTYRMSGPERNQVNQIDQSINLIQSNPPHPSAT